MWSCFGFYRWHVNAPWRELARFGGFRSKIGRRGGRLELVSSSAVVPAPVDRRGTTTPIGHRLAAMADVISSSWLGFSLDLCRAMQEQKLPRRPGKRVGRCNGVVVGQELSWSQKKVRYHGATQLSDSGQVGPHGTYRKVLFLNSYLRPKSMFCHCRNIERPQRRSKATYPAAQSQLRHLAPKVGYYM